MTKWSISPLMTILNTNCIFQMQPPLHTFRLKLLENAWSNVSDTFRMVNHDSSPSPRQSAHRFQCKCSPFVSGAQMSQRLLCWSASLLIRSEQREHGLRDPTSPFPFIYADSGCTRAWKIHPIRFFTSSRNMFTVEHRECGTANLLILSSQFCTRRYDLHKVTFWFFKRAVSLPFH